MRAVLGARRAIRVLTPNVSLIDFKFVARAATTVDEVNEAVVAAATDGPLKGILAAYDRAMVWSVFTTRRARPSI
jgi:glyceraldehyde 3-phosphate dehydrogenase